MVRLSRVLLATAAIVGFLIGQQNPWPVSDELQPEALAKTLRESKNKPTIVYVGFPVLYKAAHITGAKLAGPASNAAGMDLLKTTLSSIPRDTDLVIYCGCCPFDHCPNIRPAYKLVHDMGFTHAKVLVIPTNMHTDWVSKGYPTERPDDEAK